MTLNSAKDRAEELLQNLQKRARDFLDAEDGLAQSVRNLMEEKGFTSTEVRKRFDEVVSRLKANGLWDRLRLEALSERVNTLIKKVEEFAGRRSAPKAKTPKRESTAKTNETSTHA